jgi:peroxiredoxin Q/BCP
VLAVGHKAPDFVLPDANGIKHRLSDYLGKKVILYFYPKDMTSGCTRQACAFKDRYGDFLNRHFVVIGISKDDEKSHQKFINHYDLPFPLLSDTATVVCQAYGVWTEKKLYGRRYMGIQRATFIIDEFGVIIKVYEKASPKENANDILTFLDRY